VSELVIVPAVILAAGLGRRIAALTDGGPKALLELHGRSLLARSIESLVRAGFRDVVVVTGHAAERIRPVLDAAPDGMTLVERWNPRYATANNIVSFLTAAADIGDGFCLLNCDITFDPSILVDVAALDTGSWMVIDGDEPLGNEEMKVTVDADGFITRVNKGLDPAVSVGEYIGIMRLDAAGAAGLLASARRLVDAGEDQLYYEDAVDRAAAELLVRPFWTARRSWTEIDDEVDFERALRVAADLDAQPTT
jgi:choline kinase